MSIRVVIDTNVFVTALLRPGGFPETVFSLAVVGEVRLFVSAPILEEYEAVLRHPRFETRPRPDQFRLTRIEAAATEETWMGTRVSTPRLFLETIECSTRDIRWSVAPAMFPKLAAAGCDLNPYVQFVRA